MPDSSDVAYQARAQVSVCTATYTNAQSVAARLNSILSQLGYADELAVADDYSGDSIPEDLGSHLWDSRLRLMLDDTNAGYVTPFSIVQNGLAKREIIVLSDRIAFCGPDA